MIRFNLLNVDICSACDEQLSINSTRVSGPFLFLITWRSVRNHSMYFNPSKSSMMSDSIHLHITRKPPNCILTILIIKYQHMWPNYGIFAPFDAKHHRNGLPATHNISLFDFFVTNISQYFSIFHIKHEMSFIIILKFVLIKISTFQSTF